jgi:acetyl-CoA carboxylase carboxyl transferase subunit beta
VREVLARAATDVTVLGPGTSGLLLVLARFEGRSAVVLGQDRGASGPIGPDAFASVHRGLLLAGELGLPVVTVIDTGETALTRESEERGLAGEIARCIAAMMCTTVPTVSVILGQGCGAPALALLPADRTLAARHAWVAPLSPEGASAILYRSADRAPELAQAQGIRAIDLLRAAIVDTLVPELPDAADEPESFCARIGHYLAAELTTLDGQDSGQRLARRVARYCG